MKTIWKWTAEPNTCIDMPVGAEILTVQEQHGDAQVWALVDPDGPTETKRIMFYGTGHPVPDNPGKYIGTFQLKGGNLVFHGFDQGTTAEAATDEEASDVDAT